MKPYFKHWYTYLLIIIFAVWAVYCQVKKIQAAPSDTMELLMAVLYGLLALGTVYRFIKDQKHFKK